MNFVNIQNDTPPHCNCLENATVILDKQFARHIYKPNVRPQDFYSKWEKWKNNNAFPLDFDYNNCKQINWAWIEMGIVIGKIIEIGGRRTVVKNVEDETKYQ